MGSLCWNRLGELSVGGGAQNESEAWDGRKEQEGILGVRTDSQ